MTEKLYYIDGYLKETEATVTAVSGNAIILDRTIFYPEGGGQPGDRGMFGTLKIVDTVKDDDGTPLHVLEKGSVIPEPGTKASLVLDWDHRLFYMTEHSAQHLVSALLYSMHGIGTVSVHQGADGFTVETDREDIPDEILLSVEDAAMKAVNGGHRIWQDEVEHQDAESLHMRRSIKVSGRVKIVHIDGIDEVACGGVHLGNTAEIGEIVFTGKERIRGHVRTMWKCGKAALSFRRRNLAVVQRLSALFSAEGDEITSEAERVLKENTELKHRIRKLEELAAELTLKPLLSGSAVSICSELDVSAYESVIPSDYPSPVMIADMSGRFLFHGRDEEFALLKEKLSLRGGGRNGMFRGSFKESPDVFLKSVREVAGVNG